MDSTGLWMLVMEYLTYDGPKITVGGVRTIELCEKVVEG